MSASNLDAVLARRRTLAESLSRCEATRAALVAEDHELAITERVLARLAGFCRSAPQLTPVADAYPVERMLNRTTRALSGFLEGGLVAGREAIDRIRAAVEKRS